MSFSRQCRNVPITLRELAEASLLADVACRVETKNVVGVGQSMDGMSNKQYSGTCLSNETIYTKQSSEDTFLRFSIEPREGIWTRSV
jgi:hypothetical protein